MNLASNPSISGITVTGNGSNSLVLDSGNLTVDGFWNDPEIVYRLNGDVTVPAGRTLTIGAGQVVKARSFAGDDIFVDGTLIADGTPAARIIFTSDNDDTAGGDTDNNGPTGNFAGTRGSWDQIQFNATSTGSVMDNIEVRFAGDLSFGGVVASIFVNGGGLTLINSTIRHSETTGVRVIGANPTISGVEFQNNSGSAMSMNVASNPAVTDVSFLSNGLNGLNVEGGALAASTVWNDPAVVYRLFDDVTVPAGMTLTIAAGQIVKFRSFAGVDLVINGTLTADATREQPVVFTSDNDDAAGGDTDNNGPTGNFAGSRGGWNSIRLGATSTASVIDNAELRFAGDISFGGVAAAIISDGGSTIVSNSVIRETETHAIISRSDSSITATNNLIFRNSDTALRAESGATLTATNNTINGNFRGAAADGAGTTLTLKNNLITRNTRSGVFASGGATVAASFNTVFNPGAGGGDYEGLASQTGLNGNTSVDPKYFNATNSQFQLRAGSTAIDSATGTGAPAADFLGNGRFDDPNTINTGDGSTCLRSSSARPSWQACRRPERPSSSKSPPPPRPI